jgi:NAD(P) transhydrogenase subunit alpha
MKIGIPKERQEAERRVAATPDTVKRYVALGADVVVESGAGAGAAISDEAFTTAGATIGDEAAAVWAADIVLKVQRPTADEMAHLRQGQLLIGSLDPYNSKDQVQAYATAGAVAFAMELLPRTTRAQAMDVLSSQANLAGYKAVVDAMAEYGRVMPMILARKPRTAPLHPPPVRRFGT